MSIDMAPERRWRCPRPPGGPTGRFEGGGSKLPMLAGAGVTDEKAPDLVLPPISSLPPLLCPVGRRNIIEGSTGERGGLSVEPDEAGLKLKAGRAGTVPFREPGAEPRRPVGYAWRDIGRWRRGPGDSSESSAFCCGNEKSGLGTRSTGPICIAVWAIAAMGTAVAVDAARVEKSETSSSGCVIRRRSRVSRPCMR